MKFIQVQIILLKKKTLFLTNEDFSETKYVEKEGNNDKKLFYQKADQNTVSLLHQISISGNKSRKLCN